MSIVSLRSYPSVPRTDFGPAPPGYIPGVGRGAVGFTTRSDIGPAAGKDQEVPEVDGRARTVPSAHAKHAAVAVSNAALQAGAAAAEAQKKEEDLSDSRYDEFSGYSEQLFATGIYDAEDEEADLIYEAIDRRMDSRRKRQREEKVAAELEKLTKRRPRIDEQFADLKRGLGVLTEEQWDAIPEPLDFSRKNKLLNKLNPREKFTPVPDSIVAGAVAMNTSSNTMDMRTQLMNGLATPIGGTQTPATGTDQTAIGRARDKVLSLNLDRVADNVSGQTVVDPKGYLTDLNSVKVNSEAEVSDIKKARLLLKSVITTNPTHAPGWIAAARLEKETGKLVTARQTIAKGCEVCPTNEDVWLEAASMQTQRNAKAILAKAVTFIPTSIKIWMQACALEDDIEAKKAVLRRALELIPNSVKLWKAAVELEQPEDARIMLGRAVELVPQSVEMWLALAKLETYEKARIVLNRARKAIPTEPAIWITAAKLEEANGNVDNVQIIIDKAVTSLTKFQVTIDRDAWLQEAESADRSGSSLTCAAIVRATIGINVELEDRKNTWLADAEHYLSRQSMGVARAIYQHMLTIFPGKKSVWLKAASLERTHGTKETLDALLARAVEFCPQAEILWLMAAKEKWLSGDVNGARDILSKAFAANPDSEDIWLAAVKLESETAEYARARSILEKARDRAGTARVWMKSAKLERMLGDNTAQQSLLTRALDKFPNYYKLWIMQAQLYTQQHQIEQARDTYKKGIKICPNAVDLWLCYAQFEITSNPQPEWGRARSILETARHKNPKEPRLWLQAIRIEQDANQLKVAQQLMAKALQECPSAGILWSHAIATDARPLRKARSYDALKRCNDDAHVFIAVAKLFWLDRKVSKARNWFNRAVTVDPDLGDAWAWFYVFESEQENHTSAIKHESVKMETSSSTSSSSSSSATSSILNRIRIASPSHGELWTNISKQDQYQGKKADEILLLVIQQPVFKEIFPNPKTISE